MHSRTHRLWGVATMLYGLIFALHARAEDQDRAALATALNKASTTLEQGLRQ